MRNFILTMMFAVLTAFGANAQTTDMECCTTTLNGNAKGDWYVGTGDIDNVAWTEWSIAPTIGYAFSDDYMIGMSVSQADSTQDINLSLNGRYFYKGFFGYAAINDFDFDQVQVGVGKMFTFHKGSIFVDPKIVYDLGLETTNLTLGFGLKF